MPHAHGHAILEDGFINVATVSPHARGAKRNWLHLVAHITPMNGWSDALIERMWVEHHGTARCVPVTIIEGMH